jgi:Ribbon-helix-helix protein, copG family.
MSTRPISAKVPDDLYDRLHAAAERNDRSKSWITEQALQNYLDEDESRHRMTLAALADVDAGRTMTDEGMDAWMTEAFGPAPAARADD